MIDLINTLFECLRYTLIVIVVVFNMGLVALGSGLIHKILVKLGVIKTCKECVYKNVKYNN